MGINRSPSCHHDLDASLRHTRPTEHVQVFRNASGDTVAPPRCDQGNLNATLTLFANASSTERQSFLFDSVRFSAVRAYRTTQIPHQALTECCSPVSPNNRSRKRRRGRSPRADSRHGTNLKRSRTSRIGIWIITASISLVCRFGSAISDDAWSSRAENTLVANPSGDARGVEALGDRDDVFP